MTTAFALLPDDSLLLPLDLDWSELLSDEESSEELSASSSSVDGRPDLRPKRADARARRRELRATSARRRRAQGKNEVDALRAEATALEDCLQTLRRQRAVTDWYEVALGQLRTRQKAEAENAQLKLALAGVRTSVHDLSAFLSVGFLNTGVNMRDLLHSYTHLVKDPRARKRDYLAICSQQKLDLAYEIVFRETRKLQPWSNEPRIHVQVVPSRPDELAITTYAQLVLDTTDLTRAFVACGRAYLACNVGWASFRPLLATPRAKEAPSRDIRYSVCEAQYSTETTGEIVLFEERNLTYWKLDETCGVVVWDYVDVDELYPSKHSVDARRHTTAAMVVRRELCPDGFERVISSIVCTKTFHFLPHGNPIVALETVGSTRTIISDTEIATKLVQRTIFENLRHLPDGICLD